MFIFFIMQCFCFALCFLCFFFIHIFFYFLQLLPLILVYFLYFFCNVTFTRFTISHHTLPPIEVDHCDYHNSQLDMVHKQACMVVYMPCNCTVVFGRQLCNYSGLSAGGFLGQQSYWS